MGVCGENRQKLGWVNVYVPTFVAPPGVTLISNDSRRLKADAARAARGCKPLPKLFCVDSAAFIDVQTGAWCSEIKGVAFSGGCYMVGFARSFTMLRTPT